MTTVVVMGSCLTNLACIFLMSEYKWVRPNNAAVLRSDYFVEKFIERKGYVPNEEEFRALLQWKAGHETDGPRWLIECYRDTVGHLDIPLERPGLFETLETQKIDVVLMDNLHETHSVLLHNRPKLGEQAYSLPFSMSRCENEKELIENFYYGSPLEAAESVENWVRIIRFVQEKQPWAQILFYCAHACTSTDLPGRHDRTRAFHALMAPRAAELGITVIPPFELPLDLTRMPEDRDHFDMRVYRAMAGHIVLCHLAKLSGVAEPNGPPVTPENIPTQVEHYDNTLA
jgi:hypothetical protein